MFKWVAIAILLSPLASARVSSISVTFNQDFDAPRWMFDPNAKIKGGPLVEALVQGKRALRKNERGPCLVALQKALGLGKSLAPWIVYNQVQCAMIVPKNGTAHFETLAEVVQKIDSNPQWLISGPWSQLLRQSYKTSLMTLLAGQVRGNRNRAWKNIDRLKAIENWLSTEDKSQLYRWAGELAFIEQNLVAAQEFIERSLSAKDSAELRAKLESIRLTVAGKKKPAAPVKVETSPGVAIEDLGVSDQEKEIYQRMNRAIDSQEYISAVEDGLTLLESYPGSTRSQEAADKILDIYLSIASRTEDSFRHVRERVVKEMARGDADRLYRWANNAFARGNYADALLLAEKSLSKYQTQPETTKTLLLAARAAYAASEYTEAKNYFEKLTTEHSGTGEAAEAIFRLGLLEFRRQKYSQSLAYFERVTVLSSGKDFTYRGLYWQWRAQQKVRPEKAPELAQKIIDKYPFTYYAMRAEMETNGGTLKLNEQPLNIKVDLHLLESERMAWERMLILLKAGWFGEAQSEIELLPPAQSADEKMVRAKLWATAFRYDLASAVMGEAFEENKDLARSASLKVIYPLEFNKAFSRESKANSLDENLARALARQESSFRVDAKSPSGALGVMQLMGPTAQELAKDLRMKDFVIPDSLFDPEINIKLGSLYLTRLVRSFNGNVALAAAAYNVGPARLRRWLGARKDLSQGDGNLATGIENELWVDELPWDETSYYVKSVLRNMMIYRLLANTTVKFGDPVWRN